MESKRKSRIEFRIQEDVKKEWVEYCKKNGLYLSEFIINSVEGNVLNSERKEIIKFIEKQGNHFAKVENNINQIARTVNAEKHISISMLEHFNSKLKVLLEMKEEQNKMFRKLYTILAR